MKKKRSNFVSNISWVFIALSGFMLLVSIMQNFVINMIFPVKEVKDSIHGTGFIVDLSRFIVDHIQVLMVIVALLFLGLFVSSIGLLKRKNWARLAMIFFMVIGIIYSVGGTILQRSVTGAMDTINNDMQTTDSTSEAMTLLITILSFLISLGIVSFFSWTIYKLTSKSVIKEFKQKA